MPLIRVNKLSPGYIRTSGTEEETLKKNPDLETQWAGENMLLRLSTPDEYWAPVVFMLGGTVRIYWLTEDIARGEGW